MLLDIYKDSLEYAFQDGKTLLKLGALSCFSFLILPIFLVMGYYYRTIKIAIEGMINGEDKVPEFGDWNDLFFSGIKFFLVSFVYMLIPVVVGFIFSYLSKFSGYIFGIGALITFILLINSTLLILVAIPHMIENNGSLKAAFEIKELYEIIKSIGVLRFLGFCFGLLIIISCIYAVSFIILMIILTFGGIISFSILSGGSIFFFSAGFLIIAFIFAFLICPFVSIFQNRAIGLIYNIRD